MKKFLVILAILATSAAPTAPALTPATAAASTVPNLMPYLIPSTQLPGGNGVAYCPDGGIYACMTSGSNSAIWVFEDLKGFSQVGGALGAASWFPYYVSSAKCLCFPAPGKVIPAEPVHQENLGSYGAESVGWVTTDPNTGVPEYVLVFRKGLVIGTVTVETNSAEIANPKATAEAWFHRACSFIPPLAEQH